MIPLPDSFCLLLEAMKMSASRTSRVFQLGMRNSADILGMRRSVPDRWPRGTRHAIPTCSNLSSV